MLLKITIWIWVLVGVLRVFVVFLDWRLTRGIELDEGELETLSGFGSRSESFKSILLYFYGPEPDIWRDLAEGLASIRTFKSTRRLKALALINLRGGRIQNASAYSMDLLDLARSLDEKDLPLLVMALEIRGVTCFLKGDFENAEKCFREALSLVTEGDEQGLARINNNLGLTLLQTENFQEAVQTFKFSLVSTLNVHGAESLLYWIRMGNLADALKQDGQQGEAQLVYREIVDLLECINEEWSLLMASWVHSLANNLLSDGHFEIACYWQEISHSILADRLGQEDANVLRLNSEFEERLIELQKNY